MKLLPTAGLLIVVAVAFDLSRALITHNGVGPLEWAAGIALVALLGWLGLRLSRQVFSRG